MTHLAKHAVLGGNKQARQATMTHLAKHAVLGGALVGGVGAQGADEAHDLCVYGSVCVCVCTSVHLCMQTSAC